MSFVVTRHPNVRSLRPKVGPGRDDKIQGKIIRATEEQVKLQRLQDCRPPQSIGAEANGTN
jgi:hypothetical protein